MNLCGTVALLCMQACMIATNLAKQTDLPVVGLILQPSSDRYKNQVPLASKLVNYVPESYVQQITNAGGHVAFIPWDLEIGDLETLMDQTDMLLIPGGPTDLIALNGQPTVYQDRVDWLIRYAKARHTRQTSKNPKDIYPVFATCLGFENVIISEADQNTSVLQVGFNNTNTNRTIQLNTSVIKNTKYYKQLNLSDLTAVFDDTIPYYYHNFGVLVSHFLKNPLLKENFHVVGQSSKPGLDAPFVAIIEHKKFPILAHQWHPEKHAGEKGPGFQFIDRSRRTLQLYAKMFRLLLDNVRHLAKPIESKPALNGYLAGYTDAVQTLYTGSDRIYVSYRTLFDAELGPNVNTETD